MKSARMVIDFPERMPLGSLHKALAEVARQQGLQLKFSKTDVPKGTYFELVPAYVPADKGVA